MVLAHAEQVVELGDLIYPYKPPGENRIWLSDKGEKVVQPGDLEMVACGVCQKYARVTRVRAPRQASSAVSPPIDSPPPPFPGYEGATLSLSLTYSRLYGESL